VGLSKLKMRQRKECDAASPTLDDLAIHIAWMQSVRAKGQTLRNLARLRIRDAIDTQVNSTIPTTTCVVEFGLPFGATGST
jgi:hypothetical protein